MGERNHVPAGRGFLCGVKSGDRCPAFQRPTCARCDDLRDGSRRIYVATAMFLLRNRSTVSAGEVAYHVHGRGTYQLADLTLEAEEALREAGFTRTSLMGGRFSDITLWKAAS